VEGEEDGGAGKIVEGVGGLEGFCRGEEEEEEEGKGELALDRD